MSGFPSASFRPWLRWKPDGYQPSRTSKRCSVARDSRVCGARWSSATRRWISRPCLQNSRHVPATKPSPLRSALTAWRPCGKPGNARQDKSWIPRRRGSWWDGNEGGNGVVVSSSPLLGSRGSIPDEADASVSASSPLITIFSHSAFPIPRCRAACGWKSTPWQPMVALWHCSSDQT